MRPGSLALVLQPQQFAASPETTQKDYFLALRDDVVRPRYLNYPCLHCKRHTHPTMQEYVQCCKYDSYREVSRLVIKAYTVSFLLLAMVVLWTAGDACLYFGFSYLDYRFGRLNNHTGFD